MDESSREEGRDECEDEIEDKEEDHHDLVECETHHTEQHPEEYPKEQQTGHTAYQRKQHQPWMMTEDVDAINCQCDTTFDAVDYVHVCEYRLGGNIHNVDTFSLVGINSDIPDTRLRCRSLAHLVSLEEVHETADDGDDRDRRDKDVCPEMGRPIDRVIQLSSIEIETDR